MKHPAILTVILPAVLALAMGTGGRGAHAETAGLPDTLSSQKLAPATRELRVLKASEADRYRQIFAALRESRWADASASLAAVQSGPLQATATAELYLAKGSPKVELPQIMALLDQAPEIPQAEQLARLARTRGAETLPMLPTPRRLNWLGGAPRRERLDSGIATDPAALSLKPAFMQFIKADLPGEAEALVESASSTLTPGALTELRYMIAWSWYGIGNDDMARAVASRATGGTGDWAGQAHWIIGLAAWRQQDCNTASTAFSAVAANASDRDLRAAGNFWAARADVACSRPQQVQARMRRAAAEPESFYGLLASQYLGIARHDDHAPRSTAAGRELMHLPNIKAAAALIDIGEFDLADRLIRHQARIGEPGQHSALIALTAQWGLPNTQLWLSQNGPAGTRMAAAARYPTPNWNPANGWRVDRSLLLAHSLQESAFRPGVVSPAGAQGLMQVMPGTAAIIARDKGETVDRVALNNPSVNMEYGQSYLESLRDRGEIAGLLPKVIAAYNAGPGAVARWNQQVVDRGDPLLYIESIPYWETRNYVMIVLRNYWMYQRLDNKPATSLSAMAQGMWPRFPGMPGKTAMRIIPRNGKTASAD